MLCNAHRRLAAAAMAVACILLPMGGTGQTPPPAEDAAPAPPPPPMSGPSASMTIMDAGALGPEAPRPAPPPQPDFEDDGTNTLRDPFWPVRYVPKRWQRIATATPSPLAVSDAVGAAPPDWRKARKTLAVQGIIGGPGGRFLARVNHELVGVGDIVTVSFEGNVYRWRIRSITWRGVETEEVDVRPTSEGEARQPADRD